MVHDTWYTFCTCLNTGTLVSAEFLLVVATVTTILPTNTESVQLWRCESDNNVLYMYMYMYACTFIGVIIHIQCH